MKRIVFALLVFTNCAFGQSFEVASIRLHKDRVQVVGTSVSGQRLNAEAISLDNLITYAYDLKSYQVLGVPGWADSKHLDCDRYDLTAKAAADGPLTQKQAKAMLQALLAERFHLRFHREMREMPVYALVVAKGGPKLKEAAPDAQPMFRMRGGTNGAEIEVTGGSMAQLVNQFSNINGVDRPVLDKTGLTGKYDFKLTWAAGLNTSRDDAAAPSAYTALQDQLGLRLEPQRAPIEVLVVDNAEKPSEN